MYLINIKIGVIICHNYELQVMSNEWTFIEIGSGVK